MIKKQKLIQVLLAGILSITLGGAVQVATLVQQLAVQPTPAQVADVTPPRYPFHLPDLPEQSNVNWNG